MKPARQMLEMIRLLKDEYPISRTALRYETPHQMLVATILSAQCTDVRVNMVTEELFTKYKGINEFADADLQELEQDIRSTGFYRQKAKNIKNSSIAILENFSGNVPGTMEELITLPGVGRKTANVVLSSAYDITEGIAVDTHVKRLSFRLGLTLNTDPEKIEQDLMALLPREAWAPFGHLLIYHGRAVCTARKPACEACPVQALCPSAGKV